MSREHRLELAVCEMLLAREAWSRTFAEACDRERAVRLCRVAGAHLLEARRHLAAWRRS